MKWLLILASIMSITLVVEVIYKKQTGLPAAGNSSAKPVPSVPEKNSANPSIVLTKQAVDELVKKAADQQYLQDVLTSSPKLPPHRHATSLQAKTTNEKTKPVLLPEKSKRVRNKKTVSNPQNCIYNGKAYSIGEIVQIDKGWIRCTPSITINADGSSHYGQAVWILKDKLFN
jgi:hypothetical protein